MKNSDRPAPHGTYWVVPGQLLAGEYPGEADDAPLEKGNLIVAELRPVHRSR